MHVLRFAFLALACGAATMATAAKPTPITEVRAKAEAGDQTASYELGLRYDTGRGGVARDPTQAAAWYRRAAEGGLAAAQNSLGSLYQAGDGVEQSFAEAMAWYQKAADQAHAQGIHNLGFLYDEGKGVAEDNTRAIALYVRAAEQGWVESMVNLASMYRTGDGIPSSPREAFKWIDLARFYTQQSKDRNLKWGIRGMYDRWKASMPLEEVKAGEALAVEWEKEHRSIGGA
jgi:TPR repeat protein